MLLVDVLEDVRSIDEKVNGPPQRHSEENVQLKTIDHQSNVLPVLLHLEMKMAFKEDESRRGKDVKEGSGERERYTVIQDTLRI